MINPAPAKVCMKLLYDILENFVEKQNNLCENQQRARAKRKCADNIFLIQECVRNNVALDYNLSWCFWIFQSI